MFPPAPMTRQQEKAELQHLNDRVQNYIAKVRKMREEANNVSIQLHGVNNNIIIITIMSIYII